MPDDTMDKLSSAKKALEHAKSNFPSTRQSPYRKVYNDRKAAPAAASSDAGTNPLTGSATGSELQQKGQNVEQYRQATNPSNPTGNPQ